MYVDDTGFRVLEYNMSASLGGIDAATLSRAYMEQPFMAEFAAEHNLGFVDTMVEAAETLKAECDVQPGTRPIVAFCDWPGSYPDLEAQLIKNTINISKLGVEAFPCHLGQMRIDENSEVWVGDKHVDIIYRSFLIEDLLDPTGPGLIEPVLRAAERGKVKIFSPMDAELYGSKGALALLSDEANRGSFNEQELEVLDRILPWTRMVRPGPVTVDGRSVKLEDYALTARDELILKPVMLHGGSWRGARLADRSEPVGRHGLRRHGRRVRAAAAHPPAYRTVPLRRGTQGVPAGLGRLPRRPWLLRGVPAWRAGRGAERGGEHADRRVRFLLLPRTSLSRATAPGHRPAGRRRGHPRDGARRSIGQSEQARVSR